jgi:hypothetical protein
LGKTETFCSFVALLLRKNAFGKAKVLDSDRLRRGVCACLAAAFAAKSCPESSFPLDILPALLFRSQADFQKDFSSSRFQLGSHSDWSEIEEEVPFQ